MKNILVIKSSLNGEQGQSSQLTNLLVAQLKKQLSKDNEVNVTERDLAAQPLPHLTQAEMSAWNVSPAQRSSEQARLSIQSDNLIEELLASDVVVLGMPMYNFGVPSTFKAWIDRIARAGVTFNYTNTGPVGLLQNKKVFIVAARGGMYAGSTSDSQTQYLTDVLAFVGLTDVQFIYAEGLNMPEKEKQLTKAKTEIELLSI